MEIEKHLARTKGKGKEVHEFLDMFYKVFGNNHRVIFHHKAGIEWICKIFGDEAREIAYQHIHDDLYGTMFDGPIPEGPDDYKLLHVGK